MITASGSGKQAAIEFRVRVSLLDDITNFSSNFTPNASDSVIEVTATFDAEGKLVEEQALEIHLSAI